MTERKGGFVNQAGINVNSQERDSEDSEISLQRDVPEILSLREATRDMPRVPDGQQVIYEIRPTVKPRGKRFPYLAR